MEELRGFLFYQFNAAENPTINREAMVMPLCPDCAKNYERWSREPHATKNRAPTLRPCFECRVLPAAYTARNTADIGG